MRKIPINLTFKSHKLLSKLFLDQELESADEIVPHSVRKFEIEGHDIIEAKWLPELSISECQRLCGKVEGCKYFSSSTGSGKTCQLKGGSAEIQWKEASINPYSKSYSGSPKYGRLDIIWLKII